MKALFLLFSMYVLSFASIYNNNYVDFKKIAEKNIDGNIKTIGNTVECVTRLKYANSKEEINGASCENNYSKYYNNKYLTKYINVIDNNSSIFNSSRATLKFPSSYKKIVWAGLFWQGHINNYSYQYSRTSLMDADGYDKYYNNQTDKHKTIKEYINSKGVKYYQLSNDLPDNDPDKITETDANKIILIINDQYHNLTSKEVDYKSDSRKFRNKQTGEYERKKGVKYSAYVVLPQNIIDELNSIAASNSNKEVNITVANITTTFGLDERLGDYGAWSLVVIYEEEPKPQNYRSNIVYYGFKNLSKTNKIINININGLALPKYGNVSSRLSIFSAEGEYKNKGDEEDPESIKINDEFLEENLDNYDKYNVFDGRLSDNIERKPKLENNDGIDIDVFDASDQLTKIRDDEKEDNSSRVTYDVNISASTKNDGVFLSTIAFSTQLYVPKVCYYDFDLYDKDGNKITSGSQISVGDTLKVKYKIRNDENETAVNVHVFYPFENNITKYIENSTNIKNVLSDDFIHIEDNQSIDNLGVDVNESGLYIGILGDSDNEFKPYSYNKNYVAGIEFNVSLEHEGNLTFNFYTDYNYTVGEENLTYNGILPKCNEFNNTYYVYQSKIGRFNVVHYQPSISKDPIDINNSVNALYTQIVNKEFNVTVVKLTDDNETIDTNYKGLVEVDLINNPESETECVSNSSLWYGYVIFHNNIPTLNLTYSNANRNLRFRVKYLTDRNGNLVEDTNNACLDKTYNCIWGLLTQIATSRYGNSCPTTSNSAEYCDIPCAVECNYRRNRTEGGGDVPSDECFKCVFSNYSKSVCSRDYFAVRPDKYRILAINNQILTSGEDINITVQALDYNGNLINDFNFSNAPVELNITDAIGCNTGNFTPNTPITVNFINGEANLTFNYKDVGDLNISVREYKNNNFYAKADESDTVDSAGTKVNDDVLLIGEGNSTLSRFYPDHFSIVGTVYKNYNNSNFTYISNDLNMSSVLNLNITAENAQGGIAYNYNKECYAKNFDVNISHSVPSVLDSNTLILFKDEDGNEHNVSLNHEINLTNLSKDYFSTDHNGSAIFKVYINFEKDYKKPVNNFNFTINDINVTDNEANGSKTLNQSAQFYYGRIFIDNVAGYNSTLSDTAKYQYWNNNDWVLNTNHINNSFGEIKSLYINSSDVNYSKDSLSNGLQKVTLSTTHALPYKVKVHVAVPSWLWYHPLAKNYQDPSLSNQDCLTHPCFNAFFEKDSKGWGGVGINTKKYKETNRTSEINSSLDKINVNKKSVKKLNW